MPPRCHKHDCFYELVRGLTRDLWACPECRKQQSIRPDSDIPQWAKDAAREMMQPLADFVGGYRLVSVGDESSADLSDILCHNEAVNMVVGQFIDPHDTGELEFNLARIIARHARRAAFGLERVRDEQSAREWLREMGFGGEK